MTAADLRDALVEEYHRAAHEDDCECAARFIADRLDAIIAAAHMETVAALRAEIDLDAIRARDAACHRCTWPGVASRHHDPEWPGYHPFEHAPARDTEADRRALATPAPEPERCGFFIGWRCGEDRDAENHRPLSYGYPIPGFWASHLFDASPEVIQPVSPDPEAP